jgi:hypothetical protein
MTIKTEVVFFCSHVCNSHQQPSVVPVILIVKGSESASCT